MIIDPLAGTPAPTHLLVNIPKLISAYFNEIPDPKVLEQSVVFGTSGHRGCPFKLNFNEWHILAITQAICLYRDSQSINGPLFIGIDTHALSEPALATALEVLAANEVTIMLSLHDEYTPTPAVSHAILTYNRGRSAGLADGIVITPSHNPPQEGGFKYNAINGGPADPVITQWIEKQANALMKEGLRGVKRVPYQQALKSPTTHRYDFLSTYVKDLKNVIDFRVIHQSDIPLAVDPLGGAGVHYWKAIKDEYQINLTVVSENVDPTFRFMSVDWDGQIRMDPSSSYAMQRLLALQKQYAVAFACDTDHDRHGIVTPSCGLLQPNQFFSAAIHYLCQQRPNWNKEAAIGKTVVSSAMIDRVSRQLERKIYEVPVGFKWFVDGLLEGTLAFGCEESAGASFLRFNGEPWSTDKDGMISSLLAAEMTAKLGKDPGVLYQELAQLYGSPIFERIEEHISPAERQALKTLSPNCITSPYLAGEEITQILTKAPGNGAPIGGIKVETENGWFAVRPSGTESIFKVYAESFKGKEHLKQIQHEALDIVKKALFSLT